MLQPENQHAVIGADAEAEEKVCIWDSPDGIKKADSTGRATLTAGRSGFSQAVFLFPLQPSTLRRRKSGN